MKYLSIPIVLFLFSCAPMTIMQKTNADNTSYVYPSAEKIISQIHIAEARQDTSTDNTPDTSHSTEKIIHKIQKTSLAQKTPLTQQAQNAGFSNSYIVLPSGDIIIYQTQKTQPVVHIPPPEIHVPPPEVDTTLQTSSIVLLK